MVYKLACVKASVAGNTLGQKCPCEFESHSDYYFGALVQLARTSALQAEGRGFEYHMLHHFKKSYLKFVIIYILLRTMMDD